MKLPVILLRNGWTIWHMLGAAALAATAVAVTWNAWADIGLIAYKDEESSQIYLAPFVAAWLFWVRRRRLRSCRPTGVWIGPTLAVIGLVLFTYGDGRYQSVWHFGAVLTVLGAAFSVLGSQMLRQFLPGILVLGFLVPVPGPIRQQIAIPLQSATAMVSEHVLLTLGAPVTRRGSMLSINGADVTIAEACNGLRMVFTLLLVSVAFVFSTPLRAYVRVIVIAASPLSAILCNVVRLIPTVFLHGYADKDMAEWFHDFSGWLMLVVSLVLLIAIIRLLRWALVPVTRYTLATN